MGDKNHTQAKPQEAAPKSGKGQSHGKHHNHHPRGRSTSSGSKKVPTKEDLWKGAEVKTLADNSGWIVEMTGLDSKSHTVYARAVQTADYKPSTHPSPCVRDVVESVVDVAWKHVAKHILEAKNRGAENADEILMVDLDHWNQGAFPPANQLLELGAVWLVNETSFLQQEANNNGKKHHHSHTKKKRLTSEKHGEQQPDWKDYVLRVHYAPNRFHAMEEVDWAKYCRGLLLGDGSVQVFLGGKLLAAHDHILPSGYPDKKDGVIVYEDAEHGFVVLNKPGTVPDHATVNNHAEDVLSVFSHVLQDREKETREHKAKGRSKSPPNSHYHSRSAHVSLPLPLDTETQGLVVISTRRAFASYLTNMVEASKATDTNGNSTKGVMKKYKALVCVKKPEDMMSLNNLQESGAVVKHYYHHNPNHKNHINFVDEIPKDHHAHEYGTSQIRLLKIGTKNGLYAANVTADSTVGDAHLAHRLWGLGVQNQSKTPAEDLGIAYVAQLEFEQIVDAEQLHNHVSKPSRLTPQQMICGQLAAMGFPLVGDTVHGGGTSEVWGHRHGWNRLALQCCEWSFPQPQWTNEQNAGVASSEEGSGKADTPASQPSGEAPKEEKKEDGSPKGKDGDEWKTVSGTKKPHGNKDTKQSDQASTTSAKAGGKNELLASPDERCVFRLNEAWWNPLLDEYHVEGF